MRHSDRNHHDRGQVDQLRSRLLPLARPQQRHRQDHPRAGRRQVQEPDQRHQHARAVRHLVVLVHHSLLNLKCS